MLKHHYTRLHSMIIGAICAAALLAPPCAHAAIGADRNTAVIFVYQRVGEDPSTQGNISLEQFKAHVTELTKGGYAVLPLPKIVDTLQNGGSLPPRTVGLTFDGAYQASLANALPLLEEAKLPFTVFFASDMADGSNPGHMGWNQLRRLKKNPLASLGLLPADYAHMVHQRAEQNSALVNRAIAKYREMFNEDPQFFSYPYGEYDAVLKKQLDGYNFKGIFGQQSGVIHAQSDFLALPRFTMSADYGDLERFILTANALPLPVSEAVPEDAVLTQNPPIIGFTVTPELGSLGKLSCFGSGLGKLKLIRLGGGRVEIRPGQPFLDRRTRINCTLPEEAATGETPSWRWFGMLLIAPAVEEDAGETSTDVETSGTPENQ